MKPLGLLACITTACSLIELIASIVSNQSIDGAFMIAFSAGLPVVLAWTFVFVSSIVTATTLLRRRRSVMAILSPIIPITAFIASQSAIPYVQYPQDYTHVRAMRSTYDGAVSRLPKDGRRFAEFNWGGLLFASKGVVYDETDEVGLPYGHQSTAWKRRMRSTDLTCGGGGPVGEVMPLGQHYYVGAFGC